MITESSIYWITRLDYIHKLLLCIIAPLIIGGGICVISVFSGSWLLFKKSLFIWLLVFLFATIKTFIPTTNEMACIKLIPAIYNSKQVEQIRQDFPELYSMTKSYIKTKIEEKKQQ